MTLSQLVSLARRFGTHSRKGTKTHRVLGRQPSFNLESLEGRVLLSVVGGAIPTVDLTDRLNGAANGDPQLNTAIVVNGALYTNDIDIADIGAGSGILDSFVRVSDANDTMTQGYNTTGRPVQYQENTSEEFTHNLPLIAVPIISFNGHMYREFRLDINENNTDKERWLSVDTIQIWQSSTASLHSGFVPAEGQTQGQSYTAIGFTTGATGNYLAYSLDSGAADNWVGMNYALNAGSGVADMVLLVPNECFDPNMQYVYLYSQFGAQPGKSDISWQGETFYDRSWEQGDGYEEWAVAPATPAEKSGVKFLDRNGDGVREVNGADGIAGNADDEVGLAGWTIYVYQDTNEDGNLDSGEGLVASTVTSDGTTDVDGDGDIDPIGSYWFKLSGISYQKIHGDYVFAGGHYIVLEEARAGWSQSLPGTDVVDTGSAPGASQFGYAIELTPGERDTGNDFGNYQNATKSGVKYEDMNADGDKDGGDTVLSGWTIAAFADNDGSGTLNAGDTLADSKVTDGTGYSFSLKPGKYIIVEQVSDQTGWHESPDADTALPTH